MKNSAFMEESQMEVVDNIVGAVLEGESAALSAEMRWDGGTGNLLGSCYDLDMPCCSGSPQIHLGKGVQPLDASTGMDFLTGDGGKEDDDGGGGDDDDDEVEGFEEQMVLSAESGLLTEGYNLDLDDDDDDDYGDEDNGAIEYDGRMHTTAPDWDPRGAHGDRDGDGKEEEILHSHWRVSVEGFMSEEKSIAAFEEAVIAQRLFRQLGAKNSRYSVCMYVCE